MGPGKACPGQTEPRASTAHALHRPGPCPSAASHGGIPAPLLLSSQSHLSPWPPGTLWTRSSSLGGHQVLLLAMQMWFQAPGRGRGHLAGAEVGEVGRPGLCLSDPQLQLPERRDPPRVPAPPTVPAWGFSSPAAQSGNCFLQPFEALKPGSRGAWGRLPGSRGTCSSTWPWPPVGHSSLPAPPLFGTSVPSWGPLSLVTEVEGSNVQPFTPTTYCPGRFNGETEAKKSQRTPQVLRANLSTFHLLLPHDHRL